jgi:NAD(P)-dependent dehydrogenase (short-subunit alcohol dehydrogenase family)
VVVADVLDDAGQDTVKSIANANGSARFIHLDASSPEDNEAAVRDAVDAYGSLDVLVTAAGITHAGYRSGDRTGDAEMLARSAESFADPSLRLRQYTLEDWTRVLDVNLTGTFLAVRAAADVMATAGRGSIITLASIAAKAPEAGPLAYAVSKAGVWMLTKHAARSLGPSGVRVNAIGPGFIATNMTRIITEMPMIQDQLMTQIPMGRMGRPEEVASVALFLASDESAYMTGEILHPDGGFFTD